MTTIYCATLHTRHYCFEAFGNTHDGAWGTLIQGLKRHGAAFQNEAWFAEFIPGIEVRPFTLDQAYRDREIIPQIKTKEPVT